jgi:hypothetical protein
VLRTWQTRVLLGLALVAAVAGLYTATAVLFVGFVLVSTYLKFQLPKAGIRGTTDLGTEVNVPTANSMQATQTNDANSGLTSSSLLCEKAEPAAETRDSELYDDLLADDPDEFAFESDHTIQLERSQKRYRSFSHTPDYDAIWESVYEYRIEGTKVFQRVLESKTDSYGEVEYEVRDNIVLEHEIRQSYPEKSKLLAGWGVDEVLERWRASVAWSEVFGRLKYFILSRHPEMLATAEARRYFRQELQPLQCGFDAVVQKAAEFGGTLVEQETCRFDFPDDTSNDSIPQILSEESLQSYNISLADFTDGKNRIAILKRLLGDEN